MDILRRRIILAAASTPAPERVAYIRGGDDGSYIDTGIAPNDTTRIIVWARNWVPYGEHLFGTREGIMVNELALAACDKGWADNIRLRIGAKETFVNGAIMDFFTNYHKYEINGKTLLVDDIPIIGLPDATLNTSLTIHLFGINDAGTHSGMLYPADIHACQIYQNGSLVRDFVAVNTPSVGFYDSVSNMLFTNAGGGSFTYNEFNPYAYTQLAYIKTSGNTYFHTGVFGTGDTDFLAKYQLGANTTWAALFGAETAKNTERFSLNFGTAASPGISMYFWNYTQELKYTKPTTTIGMTYIDSKVGTDCYVIRNTDVPSASTTIEKTMASTHYDYTTKVDITVGGINQQSGGVVVDEYAGLIHYIRIGKERNFVPALVGGVAGLYDTYNDKFYQSETDTQFTAGPTVNQSPIAKAIPYIRGGGDGSYINTGIIPDSTTTITIWARNFTPNGYEYSWLCGSRVATNDSAFDIYAERQNANGKIGFVYANGSTKIMAEGWHYFTDYHKYEIKDASLYVDDVFLTATTATARTFTSNIPIHVLGLNNNGTHLDSNMRIDICACQIHKGGQLVRDFTPRQQNGTVGLYDSVSNTLFTNAGTGSFEYGTFNANAYSRLEYITGNRDAYFDSGVYGKYTDSMICKFMPTDTTPRYYALLGCRPTSNVFDISWGSTGTSNENRNIGWRMGANASGSNSVTVFNTTSLTWKSVAFYKPQNASKLYATSGNTGQIGAGTITGVSSTFVSSKTLGVGALNRDNGFDISEAISGRLYYVRLGYDRSFVPALVSGVAGMYDTYNDTFYPSLTGSPFGKGPSLIL